MGWTFVPNKRFSVENVVIVLCSGSAAIEKQKRHRPPSVGISAVEFTQPMLKTYKA